MFWCTCASREIKKYRFVSSNGTTTQSNPKTTKPKKKTKSKREY